jgi:hypothetical protein
MILLAEESRAWGDESAAESQTRSGPWLGVILLLLAGLLVFAHGCHGDEDNELFAQSPKINTIVPETACERVPGVVE